MKKNTKATYRKSVTFLAAAAMTAALLGGQGYPMTTFVQAQTVEKGSLIPDNVTIDEPTSLSNINLPSSDYGTLSWADGSYVPDSRVQSCKVEFKPNGSIDLSGYSGWDAEKSVLTGYVTVVVSSIESGEEGYEEENADSPEVPQPEITEEPSGSQIAEDVQDTDGGQQTEGEDTSAPAVSETATEAEGIGTETAPGDETESAGEGVTAAPEAEVTAVPEGETAEPAEGETTPEAPAEGADLARGEAPVPSEAAPEVTEAPEETAPAEGQEAASAAPEAGETPTEAPVQEETNNIFDNPADFAAQDTRPATAEENLSPEEEAERARQNHSCDGIFVSGIELPWYVQFRVSSGESYEFKNEEGAMIFQSYEFELWDLRNNTEYEIPDGEYISVTVPVKEGYSYTIEHILDNGAIETIVPSVEGGTMVFSTHSFSPFGIAGSKPLVGGDIAQDGYSGQTTSAPTPTVQAAATTKPVQTPSASSTVTNTNNGAGSTGNTGNTSQTSASASSGATKEGTVRNIYGDQSGQTGAGSSQGSGTNGSNTSNNNGSSAVNTVRTGDDTVILPFVILVAAAAVIIVIIAAVKKKRNN